MIPAAPLKPERTLVLVKPDGMSDPFVRELKAALAAAELTVAHETQFHLDPADVSAIYIRTDPEFVAYVCEGPMLVLLVEGLDAVRKGRELKWRLRERHGCRHDMRNLFHSAEPGNEYEAQCQVFLGAAARPLYADECAHVTAADLPDVARRLQALQTAGVSAVGLLASAADTALIQDLEANLPVADQDIVLGTVRRERVLRHPMRVFDIAARRPARSSAWIAGQVRILAETDPDLLPAEAIVDAAQDAGATGVLCYSPHLSLAETEQRREATLTHGLFCVGGSDGAAAWGRFGVSREVYAQLASGLVDAMGAVA